MTTKLVKPARSEAQSTPLWTPWGIERPVERDARNASIKRLLRKVADSKRRAALKAVRH